MQGRRKWKFLTRASQTGAVQTSSVSFETKPYFGHLICPFNLPLIVLEAYVFPTGVGVTEGVGRLQRKVLTGDQGLGGNLHGGERNH